MFLTVFCFPFPSSEVFQSQIIPSKRTLAASKCNLEPPSTHGSQCAFSRNPIFLVLPFLAYVKVQKKPWHIRVTFLDKDHRRRMVTQLKRALYRRFKLWFSSSSRLLWKMGLWPCLESCKAYPILTTFQKQKHPLSSSFIQPSIQFTAVSQDSSCSWTPEFWGLKKMWAKLRDFRQVDRADEFWPSTGWKPVEEALLLFHSKPATLHCSRVWRLYKPF